MKEKRKQQTITQSNKLKTRNKMRMKSILAGLLLAAAGVQMAWA